MQPSPRFRWPTLAVAAVLAAPLVLPAASAVTGSSEQFLVGFVNSFPRTVFEVEGAKVVYVHKTLGFALVEAPSLSVVKRAASQSAEISYVEPNGKTRLDAARWDAARWDAATWDAARWDAARWDAATWDAARWDAATWDAARWDAASWDAARWDAATWDAARWDAASWDGSPSVDSGYSQQWSLGAMGLPSAWKTTTAYHARTICVVDSGVDRRHADLARNVKILPSGTHGYDFVDEDADPQDAGGHGTHVAGIAAAVMGNGYGIAGVSQAYVIAARVLDAEGSGTDANLARGIAYCADQGAHIVLLALHADAATQTVKKAVKYARDKGLLVVAATGNAGLSCDQCVAFPASVEGVLAVGASAPDSSVASFSNRGTRVSLLAPGVDVVGLFPGNQFAVGSGTSQATANAAGAAALVWAANPSLTAADVAARLTATAKDDGPAGFDTAYGHGHLRVDRALGGGA